MRSCTRCHAAACVIAATLAGAATAAAQTFGMIEGRVKDSTGAVLPGATVTVSNAKTGLVTFHGPMGTSDWSEPTLDWARRVLFAAEAPTFQNILVDDDLLVPRKWRTRTIVPGRATGRLIGGNLTVLAYAGPPRPFDPARVAAFPVHPMAREGVTRNLARRFRFAAGTPAQVLSDDFNPLDVDDLWLKERIRRGILESSRLPGSPYFRPGTVSDENFHTAYVDTLPIVKGSGEEAHIPTGIRVIEETYSRGADPLDDLVIAEFNVVNTGPRSLQGVWVGIYREMVTHTRLAAWPSWPPGARWFDFQDPHWDATFRMLWNHNIENRFVSVDVRGAIQIVGSGGSGAYGRGPDSVATKRVSLTAWNWSPSRFVTWTDDSLYVRMSTGRAANLDSLFDPGTEDSPVSILAVGPFDLIAPGDTVQVVFALLAGENEVDLAQNAFWAQEAYDNRYNLPVTPITVEDLAVVVLENGVHVTWRLSDEALARALGVVVQRGEFPEGPFESTTAGLLNQPERDMDFAA